MIIEIHNPTLEALIEKRLQSGAFQSVEELLEDALVSQAEEDEEDWAEEHRAEIEEYFADRIAALDRGEGVSGEASRARLQERKAAWIAENRRT